MKNVQISFDENLLDAVDRFAASAKISRSAIIRKALSDWLSAFSRTSALKQSV